MQMRGSLQHNRMDALEGRDHFKRQNSKSQQTERQGFRQKKIAEYRKLVQKEKMLANLEVKKPSTTSAMDGAEDHGWHRISLAFDSGAYATVADPATVPNLR